ncbi:nuclear transport factor 2 family protein [Amnibacterium sp. CER49]|uniref:nuclear transport factor 2 family protein n=1 Tax=Amnibacterium sp. CER49 TaxID=3039161 RepID=UPI002449A0B3|nr:nuclear transport factor 2 family protein [Amnibacterium sp. CER49]MDH2444904.1 nuclear transport factor 2 family protein [Amnibacterium sp. CER49]
MVELPDLNRVPDGPVRRMFAAARRHDLDAMVAEFAEDYVNITPNHPGRDFVGRDQVRSNWSALFAGIPDLAVEVRDAVAAPDGTVWVEWTSRGTRRDGVPVEQAGVGIFTLREGRLAAVRFYLEPVERDSGDVARAVQSVVGADGRDAPS